MFSSCCATISDCCRFSFQYRILIPRDYARSSPSTIELKETLYIVRDQINDHTSTVAQQITSNCTLQANVIEHSINEFRIPITSIDERVHQIYDQFSAYKESTDNSIKHLDTRIRNDARGNAIIRMHQNRSEIQNFNHFEILNEEIKENN